MKLTRGGYALPGTATGYKTGTWRIQKPEHRHRAAPCHVACPAGEDPQAWIGLLDEGRAQAAWEKLVSANPLPAITGRVCPHPCESGCNRGDYDEPLAIHSLERFLGDAAIEHGWEYQVGSVHGISSRVAVVGAGPAGLSAAYHLQRYGLDVTLYDESPEAGGTLFWIPDSRLPREVVRSEIGRLLDTGIRFEGNHRLGRDMQLAELESDYVAVFLAPGLMQGREWSVDGVTPTDLHDGLRLLQEWSNVGELPQMNSAAVIGGGNTAIDIARALNNRGVDTQIVIHSTLPDPANPVYDDMRAIPREIEQALEEGVTIHDHHGVKRLILRGEKLTGIEIVRMRKLHDDDGNLRRIAFEGTESVLHVDQVIPAIGQQLDPSGMEKVASGKRGIAVDKYGNVTGHDKVYAGGDAIIGNGGTVTEAVGNGRIAAHSIAAMLGITERPDVSVKQPIKVESLNLSYFESAPRPPQRVLPVEERIGEREIEDGLTANEAAHEARRCLACGECLRCDNCWTLCPDSAVLKTKQATMDGLYYVFDMDFCKGCGLCANECPTGFISMIDES